MKRNFDPKKKLKNMKGVTGFDLTPEDKKSNVFTVEFDVLTPRSRFVILPRGEEENDYSELTTEKREELIRVASTIVSEYKLEKLATLSVHRGSWLSDKYKFHAHVCADVDEYIKVFQENQEQIPDWPSAKYVTRQWKASKDPVKYEDNVRGYPFKTYCKEEIQDILSVRAHASSKDKDKKKPSDSASSDTYEGFIVLYHSNEPRVGFATVKKSNFSEKDYLKVLDAMDNYAGENNLTDINSKVEGCHLCVVFNDLKHGFDLEDGQVLQGYLQLSGSKYYSDLCPENMRESWFTEFKKFGIKGGYKVYT